MHRPKLKKHLNNRKIKILTEEMLGKESYITYLNVNNNNLEGISGAIFNNHTEIRELNLRNNRLKNLELSLRLLKNLEKFDVSYNQLGQIEPPAFWMNVYLVKIDLSYNFIRVIHENSFYELKFLKYLNLSHNYLEDIHVFTFRENKFLKTLLLGHNLLTDFLSEHIFINLVNLETLGLEMNQFSIFGEDFFFNLFQLKHLNLSSNFLTELNSDFLFFNQNIEQLNLSSNLTMEISNTFFMNLFELQTLDLRHTNPILKLSPNLFRYNQKLRQISLTKYFPHLNLAPFTHIFYSDADIGTHFDILKSLNRLENLKYMKIRNCYLNEAHLTRAYFLDKNMLILLDLSNNQLQTLEMFIFKDLTSLKYLFLENSNFEAKLQVPLFGNVNELLLFSLSCSQIEVLKPLVFMHLTKLRILYLNGNPLKSLHPEVFSELISLKLLHLTGCQLKRIGENLFKRLISLQRIHLEYNPIENMTMKHFKYNTNLRSLLYCHHVKVTGFTQNGPYKMILKSCKPTFCVDRFPSSKDEGTKFMSFRSTERKILSKFSKFKLLKKRA